MIYCRDCNWMQDDFWSLHGTGWHPFREDIVEHWIEKIDNAIRGKRTIVMDSHWVEEAGLTGKVVPKGIAVSVLDYVAYELTRTAENIINMHWLTEREFIESEKICPECGSKNLSVD